MRSAVVSTAEIDDMRLAADELVAALGEKLALQKNSCGILYYDFETPAEELAGLLEERLGFPVFGGSALATLDGVRGYHEMEVLLTVLTADDCEFSVVVTDLLTRDDRDEMAVRAFEEARGKLTMPLGLIMTLWPNTTDITFDSALACISKVSGHIPIIGGAPSSEAGTRGTVVKGYFRAENQAILLLIAGNIRPIFSLANVVTKFPGRTGTVTEVEQGVVYKIDDLTFSQYMETYGKEIRDLLDGASSMFFHQYPLLLEDSGVSDGVPYVRSINRVDRENGSGIAFADIPLGSRISLAMLQREDIGHSTRQGMETLVRRIAENTTDDYRYSTVLCVSCAARHLTMNPYYGEEGDAIRERLPAGMSLAGFYASGEFCPTSVREGAANNRVHNSSITFCAF